MSFLKRKVKGLIMKPEILHENKMVESKITSQNGIL